MLEIKRLCHNPLPRRRRRWQQRGIGSACAGPHLLPLVWWSGTLESSVDFILIRWGILYVVPPIVLTSRSIRSLRSSSRPSTTISTGFSLLELTGEVGGEQGGPGEETIVFFEQATAALEVLDALEAPAALGDR